MPVDQRTNGGEWQALGSYSFDPAATPIVVLAGGSDGTLSADAIRFVGETPAPADLRFVHTDHLGTPQKLTDNVGAVIWDRVQTPFGLTVSEAGPGVTPVRFPGQYADDETNLAYNYFRDYDPTLGRYIQSDPVGVEGGLNTYLYAGADPIRHIDFLGLWPDCFKWSIDTEEQTSKKTTRKEISRSPRYWPVIKGVGLGGSLDPRKPKKFPLVPKVIMEIWLYHVVHFQENQYDVIERTDIYWIECEEQIEGPCGKTRTFKTGFPWRERRDPIEILTESADKWEVEPIRPIAQIPYP